MTPTSDAEEALAESLAELTIASERQRRLYEAILASTPDLVYVFDLAYRFTYANPALLRMWGRSLEESVGKSLRDLGYEPWHAEMHEREIDRVVATKQPIRGEVSFPHASLGRRTYDYIFVPVFNEQGEVEAITGTTRDVTERKLVETRFRALVDAGSDVVYRMSPDWREMRWLEGRDFIADTEKATQNWMDKYIHPDDKGLVLDTIADAIRTRSVFELEHRVLRVDGSLGWTFSRAIPLLDDRGEITEWFGAASDITDERHEDERRRLLLDELNHRVKNTLSTVQSIALQTMRNTASAAEFQGAFESRLMALSQAHDLLTRGNWEGADLREIIDHILAPYADGDGARIVIDGPSLMLRPNPAVMLTLVLNELATNAAKYGALSVPDGEIAVRLAIDHSDGGARAAVTWLEHRGPKVAAPTRTGFGTRLIQRGITQQLAGDVDLDYAADGLRCRIAIPLRDNTVGAA